MIDLLHLFAEQLQQGQFVDLGFWNYPLLGVLIVLQEPVFTLLGGRAAAAGVMNPVGVCLTAVTFNLTIDLLSYFIGSTRIFGRRRWRIGPSRRAIIRMHRIMRTHAIKALLVSQFSPGLAIPALVAAGMSQVPWRRWLPIVAVAEAVRTVTYVYIGYNALHKVNPAWAGGICLLLVLLITAVSLGKKLLRWP
ncbi:MAG: VTT domain-containing protein [Anaerolineales bacterium]|nr:VTT domain-containing protein [Anaerolineales bacterium]